MGKAKDISAAAVWVIALFAAVVGAIVFGNAKAILVVALALVAAIGLTALIGGCQFAVMDVPAALTAWLDFQEVRGWLRFRNVV